MVPLLKVSPEFWLDEKSVTPQLSEAVGAVQKALAEQSFPCVLTVMSVGQPTMVGFSLSLTVTENSQMLCSPLLSVAVKVTSVVPTGNAIPEAWLPFRLDDSQLSEPVIVIHETTAEHCPASLFTVISLGQFVMVGFSLSFTVTVKLQEV